MEKIDQHTGEIKALLLVVNKLIESYNEHTEYIEVLMKNQTEMMNRWNERGESRPQNES